MQRFHLLTGCAIALALAGLLGACDDGPTRPSTPIEPPTVVTVLRLEIAGPGTVPPGESAQYSAIAVQSDGTTRDVTNGAVWRTGNQSVLTISSTGLATGRERGEAFVEVSASGRSSHKEVIVVPAGTYRLSGFVKDAGEPVLGARVEVTAGTGQGLAVTASGAFYRLYGVAGDIEVRVTRDGYQELRKSLQVTGHQTLDFDLVLARPRDEVSGTYTLTVTAAECSAALPAEARIRTYSAVLGQDGPRLVATLAGAKFYMDRDRSHNSFRGRVEPDRVTFQLSGPYDYYGHFYFPEVLEELDSTTFLTVSGSAVTTVSPRGLSGTLNGPVETLRLASGRLEPVTSCRSTGHRFVLSR